MDGGTRILTRMSVQTYPPMLDAQVQIQRLVTKSFATFDGLTHVCDNEFAPKDPPSENDINHLDTSRSEAIMDALFTKTATLFYEGCSSRLLSIMLLLLNLNTMHGVSKKSWMNFFHYCKKRYYQKSIKCQPQVMKPTRSMNLLV
jgi:hypothetical protein